MRSRVLVLGALGLWVAPALLGAVCATQNVPAATLLVPYFFVSRNGSQGNDVPEGGADTLVSITNTGDLDLIVQATLWSKYGRPALTWNIPFRAHDVASFRVKDVLNGRLNVNPDAQTLPDPCTRGAGFAEGRFLRFENPDAGDAGRAQSVYAVPAFSGTSRLRLWDSLDESGDVSSFVSPGGANVLDLDSPVCDGGSDWRLEGDFSGSLTFDVMNTCTGLFPDDARRYRSGVLATRGWEVGGHSPNVLMGDVFLVDPRSRGASGDSMVSLVFDQQLEASRGSTFYGLYPRTSVYPTVAGPDGFLFDGDGRMPLPSGYSFRFLSDSQRGLSTRLLVWRSSQTFAAGGLDQQDLCAWWRDCISGGPCWGLGHLGDQKLRASVWDNDENQFVIGSPGQGGGSLINLYVFLHSQRLDLLDNGDVNPAGFKGGLVRLDFTGDSFLNQAYVSVQHSGPGSLSAGHAATVVRSPVSCAVEGR